jgi:hypothetical protein
MPRLPRPNLSPATTTLPASPSQRSQATHLVAVCGGTAAGQPGGEPGIRGGVVAHISSTSSGASP